MTLSSPSSACLIGTDEALALARLKERPGSGPPASLPSGSSVTLVDTFLQPGPHLALDAVDPAAAVIAEPGPLGEQPGILGPLDVLVGTEDEFLELLLRQQAQCV